MKVVSKVCITQSSDIGHLDKYTLGSIPELTPMFLVYDTETTGLPGNYKAPLTDSENWPRLVQLAWQLHDADGH